MLAGAEEARLRPIALSRAVSHSAMLVIVTITVIITTVAMLLGRGNLKDACEVLFLELGSPEMHEAQ